MKARETEKVIGVSDMAACLGVKTGHLYTMIGRGQLPCARKLGRRLVFIQSEVNDFLRGLPHRTPTAKPADE